jgi:lysophospholipase L1-like esterase
MRIRLIILLVLLMLWGSALAHASAGPPYYLALGDSLAQGVQPLGPNGQDIETNQGYVDDLYTLLHSGTPNLILAKLGCPGETTTTMIQGGSICYPVGSSQLAAAVSFLQTHQVALVTLDIGANDIDRCVSLSGIDWGCVTTALSTVRSDLSQILPELRSAAGPGTLIVAMNYYDPILAAWTLGPGGQLLADESLLAAALFNGVLETTYQAFAIPVVDVAQAFHIYDFAPVPNINLPLNVFLTLSWTWMSAPPPIGPDIHANAAGYAVIAVAFANKIAMLSLSKD